MSRVNPLITGPWKSLEKGFQLGAGTEEGIWGEGLGAITVYHPVEVSEFFFSFFACFLGPHL